MAPQRQQLKTPSLLDQSFYEDMRVILLTASQGVGQWLARESINAHWLRGAPSIL